MRQRRSVDFLYIRLRNKVVTGSTPIRGSQKPPRSYIVLLATRKEKNRNAFNYTFSSPLSPPTRDFFTADPPSSVNPQNREGLRKRKKYSHLVQYREDGAGRSNWDRLDGEIFSSAIHAWSNPALSMLHAWRRD